VGIKEVRMMQIQQIRQGAGHSIGKRATDLLVDTIAKQDLLLQFRAAWKNKHRGTLQEKVVEQLENDFIQYLTACQIMALRHLLDVEDVSNEKRQLALPFIVMSFMGIGYADAEALLEHGADDPMIHLLMREEKTIPSIVLG
jgi:hypothetical protein